MTRFLDFVHTPADGDSVEGDGLLGQASFDFAKRLFGETVASQKFCFPNSNDGDATSSPQHLCHTVIEKDVDLTMKVKGTATSAAKALPKSNLNMSSSMIPRPTPDVTLDESCHKRTPDSTTPVSDRVAKRYKPSELTSQELGGTDISTHDPFRLRNHDSSFILIPDNHGIVNSSLIQRTQSTNNPSSVSRGDSEDSIILLDGSNEGTYTENNISNAFSQAGDASNMEHLQLASDDGGEHCRVSPQKLNRLAKREKDRNNEIMELHHPNKKSLSDGLQKQPFDGKGKIPFSCSSSTSEHEQKNSESSKEIHHSCSSFQSFIEGNDEDLRNPDHRDQSLQSLSKNPCFPSMRGYSTTSRTAPFNEDGYSRATVVSQPEKMVSCAPPLVDSMQPQYPAHFQGHPSGFNSFTGLFRNPQDSHPYNYHMPYSMNSFPQQLIDPFDNTFPIVQGLHHQNYHNGKKRDTFRNQQPSSVQDDSQRPVDEINISTAESFQVRDEDNADATKIMESRISDDVACSFLRPLSSSSKV